MHHSSWCLPLLLLCFYKSPRNPLLIIHKKCDSIHKNHRESPDLPLLMSSSHIPQWSSVGKSINGCLTLAGILCTPAVWLLLPPASTNSRAFLLQGWQLPPCLSAPASTAQRHLSSAGKRAQRDSSRQRRSPARLKDWGKRNNWLFNPLFSCLYKGQQEVHDPKGKNFLSKKGTILSVSLSLLSERSNFCFLEGSEGVCQGDKRKGEVNLLTMVIG